MLPSKDRLSFREVEEIFEKGERRAAPLLSLIFLPSKDRTAFGVTVSKKVAQNAVDRNKIRRRIYSALSKIKKYDMRAHAVFLPKKESTRASFSILEKEVKALLVRANILK